MGFFRCVPCGAVNHVPDGPHQGIPICQRCKHDLDLTNPPHEVDAEGLERMLRVSPVPVLVDFWASWCAPCRAVAPSVDRLARAHAGRLLVLKVNSDHATDAARRYAIRGIPTFVLFARGREVERRSGALPYVDLEALAGRAAADAATGAWGA